MGRHRPHFHHFAQADGVLWLLCRICGRGGMSRWHIEPTPQHRRASKPTGAVAEPRRPDRPSPTTAVGKPKKPPTAPSGVSPSADGRR